jgi:hypothetical protein
MKYEDYIEGKRQGGALHGFEPFWLPDYLYGFQAELVDNALRRGRSAVFADCGLGKTPMGLVWAENVARKTNKPVLYLTPLAVASQTCREAQKFDVDAQQGREGMVSARVIVLNYEQLHRFYPDDFGGVVCDESSILKSFDGRRRGEITSFMRKVPYRLLQTATAAPNDYIELGTSSEALGYLGHMDMLNKFFRNSMNNSATGRIGGEVIKWRLKGHAEVPFWRWVCSWARAVRKPSDLGFDDNGFILPPLLEKEHLVEARTLADGMLFPLPAHGLKEQREERRRTIDERCEMAAELANKTNQPALVWCHLNDEGDKLEALIPDAEQVSGKDSDDEKERKLEGFATGKFRVLITKPKIGAWGLNYQHCNHVIFFPSNSFEQYYQSIRRCWRFGQKRPVTVDVVTTEGEGEVMKNMRRKAQQADEMFSRLVAEMNSAAGVTKIKGNTTVGVPQWLS